MNWTLDFKYSDDDINNKNVIKEMLNNNNIAYKEYEDGNGIHLEYDSKDFEKIKSIIYTQDETFFQNNKHKVNYYLKIDNNGINVNTLQGVSFDNYTGAGMTINSDNASENMKYVIRFEIRSTYEAPIFVIERRNDEEEVENKKDKYEDITYMVSKETKCQILEKLYMDIKNEVLQENVQNYKKEEFLNYIVKYENKLLDENTVNKRKFEARKMNDILLKHLKDNLEEIQELYDKSNIIADNWGNTQKAYDKFKEGFEEICKKHNIKDEIYDDKYLYDKEGNEKRLKINGDAIGEELKDIIKKLNRGEYVNIDRILNNEQLQYILSSKNNLGNETINITGREKMHQKYVDEYLKNIKSVSGELDKDGKMLYNGSILNEKQVNIIIGYPASGKSTISNEISNLSHSRIVDSDEVKKFLPEYANGLGVEKVHEESKHIMREMLKDCIKANENIVLPIVGSKPKSIERYLKIFSEAGYDIKLTLVDLPKEKCMARNLMRYIETGRLVNPQIFNDYANPKDVLSMIKEDIRQQGLKYKYNIKLITEYNNDVPFGHKPELEECNRVKVGLEDITQVAKIQYNQDNKQFKENLTNVLKLK